MALKNYFPSVERMSVEIIATMIGVIGASLIISRFPKVKALVDGNSVWAITNPSNGA